MHFRQRCLSALLILTFIWSGAASARQREDAIKSGFLYNFARYSQGSWFTPSRSEFYTICSFNPEFVNIAAQTLKGRMVSDVPVKLWLLDTEFTSISQCNTVFISANDEDKWHSLNESKLISKQMLVGEFDGFIASGGQISFFIVGGKVRFEVNPASLKESGIKMSSAVLRLGRPFKSENE